jgi:hypothetical protein
MGDRFIGRSLAIFLSLAVVMSANAQGTAFTYQGQLASGGSPANGNYDLAFTLFGSTNAAAPVLAGPVTNFSVAVTSNGIFTAAMDFGPNIFTGTNIWLEIAVRTNGAASFTTLAPRQPITPTPYAIFAGAAGSLSGTLPASQISGTYTGTVVSSSGANSFAGTFSGNGSGLTNLNALTPAQFSTLSNVQVIATTITPYYNLTNLYLSGAAAAAANGQYSIVTNYGIAAGAVGIWTNPGTGWSINTTGPGTVVMNNGSADYTNHLPGLLGYLGRGLTTNFPYQGSVFTNTGTGGPAPCPSLFAATNFISTYATNFPYASLYNTAIEQAEFSRFNVRDFGAQGDGVTDDSSAIQATINACVAAGGGTVFFPRGDYLVATNFTACPGGGGFYSQLQLPVLDTAGSFVTLILEGAIPVPYAENYPIGVAYVRDTNCATIISPRTDGNVGNSAIIASGYTGDWRLNALLLEVKNLNFVVPPNPTFNGIDAPYLSVDIKDCMFDARVPGGGTVQPVNGSTAVLLPWNNNWCMSRVRNVLIIGWGTAMMIGENANVDEVKFENTIYGLGFWPCFHPARIGHVIGASSTYILSANPPYGYFPSGNPVNPPSIPLSVECLAIEHDGTNSTTDVAPWMQTVADVLDTANGFHGTVKYNIVNGGVGNTNQLWTKIGGANLNGCDLWNNQWDFLNAGQFSGSSTGLTLTNANGSKFLLQVNSATNGFYFVPQ